MTHRFSGQTSATARDLSRSGRGGLSTRARLSVAAETLRG